jgi:myosin heavy subunit
VCLQFLIPFSFFPFSLPLLLFAFLLRYQDLLTAMRNVGFSENDVTAAHVVLIAVLSVGNIDFVPDPGSADGSAAIFDMAPVRNAAALLGISSEVINQPRKFL